MRRRNGRGRVRSKPPHRRGFRCRAQFRAIFLPARACTVCGGRGRDHDGSESRAAKVGAAGDRVLGVRGVRADSQFGRREGEEWYVTVCLAREAGLRVGEIKALCWEHLDLVAGTLTVSEQTRHGITGTPKPARRADDCHADRGAEDAVGRARRLRGAQPRRLAAHRWTNDARDPAHHPVRGSSRTRLAFTAAQLSGRMRRCSG